MLPLPNPHLVLTVPGLGGGEMDMCGDSRPDLSSFWQKEVANRAQRHGTLIVSGLIFLLITNEQC